jgi:hypothetical protein
LPKLAKKRVEVDAFVDKARKYTVEEACTLVKKAKYAKFDETVDLAIRLGVNPKHADQMVRGAIVKPSAYSSSRRAKKRRRLAMRAPTSPEATTWWRRSPKGSWISIESSRRPT